MTVPPDRLGPLGLQPGPLVLSASLGLAVFLAALAVPGGPFVYPVVGFAVGAALSFAQRHPYRVLGLVPFAAVGFTLSLLAAAWHSTCAIAWSAVGATAGLGLAPLLAALGKAPRPALALLSLVVLAALFTTALVGASLGLFGASATSEPLLLGALLAAVLTAAAWRQLLRPAIEQFTEVVVAPMYRIRAFGPGVAAFPKAGPVLVICNHTAWLDPLWLGKVLPRRLKPMMTSDFYDKPAIRWLMRDVVQAIRVQTSRFRREAPELAEGVAALDAGECLVLFPEGHLRRTDEPTVRNFGRGVWHILNDRPTTPVVACWIEGGWGSYTSYFKGKPTANKRPDFWRPIRIAVAEPVVLDAALLADVRATRRRLMHHCVAARGLLGLEVPKLTDAEEDDDGKTAEKE